jgi:hypothetical protein
MKNGLTNNEIDWLRDALKACTDEGRGWLYGDSAPEGGFESPEDMAAELLGVVGKTLTMTPGDHTRHFWTIHIPDPADPTSSLIVGHTGNGPRSEAHARLLAAAPGFLARLLDEREALVALREVVKREVRGMICGHAVCGCTKHTLMRALADTTPAAEAVLRPPASPVAPEPAEPAEPAAEVWTAEDEARLVALSAAVAADEIPF